MMSKLYTSIILGVVTLLFVHVPAYAHHTYVHSQEQLGVNKLELFTGVFVMLIAFFVVRILYSRSKK
jgi:hypothetical protein